MCAIAQPIILALVAELRHGVSTELLGLLGALLRAAFPSIDIAGSIKLYFLLWIWLAEARMRGIFRSAHRFLRGGLAEIE